MGEEGAVEDLGDRALSGLFLLPRPRGRGRGRNAEPAPR